jgi:hypothetical protein
MRVDASEEVADRGCREFPDLPSAESFVISQSLLTAREVNDG